MKTRTSKAIGAAAGIAAIALSIPLAVTAHAEPTDTTTVPVAPIPDPQGPGCDAFEQSLPTFKGLDKQPVGTALANIPDISTFNSLISGQANPAVNIVPMLNNGPYVVFAPTNEAFAELPPEQLDALKADPAALTTLVYYHEFLGLLGPDDVKGQRPTQEGTLIKVTGEGGDITVNDTATVLCGAIHASNARIYLIDTVLDPAFGPEPITPSATSPEATTTTAVPETPTTAAPETPTTAVPETPKTPETRRSATPAADAPIG